ncbi:transcobalamin-1-like [Oncorhynchus mykiss]|uniref:Transcobalamin-like C-terminal domain-containing protein n=1 Tax=Oncorhynchus mykiss TaxID=8022 RepID=A0A8C7U2V6_ONCMY|nr:transcobalamin-1-like [Oncorhynchus mykiss]
MRRLQETTAGFNFTYTEDRNYGPFLVSVNGVAGNNTENTFWELLVQTGGNGTTIRPDVGIGCYIPEPNDRIILRFTVFVSGSHSVSGNSSNPGNLTAGNTSRLDSIELVVVNNISNTTNKTYSTDIAFRGVLIGAMRRLQTNSGFNFTYTEDPNYGPFLVSVNGVAGNNTEKTFWELLVQTGGNGTIIRPDVGIGCYIPKQNDRIILNFTKFTTNSASGSCTNPGVLLFLVGLFFCFLI